MQRQPAHLDAPPLVGGREVAGLRRRDDPDGVAPGGQVADQLTHEGLEPPDVRREVRGEGQDAHGTGPGRERPPDGAGVGR